MSAKQTLSFNPAKVFESAAVMPQTKGALPKTREAAIGSAILPKELYVQIEAIHAGTSRNYNRYPAEKLRGDVKIRSGMYSWNHPYPKPLIYNHDVDTEATGRIIDARYVEMTQAGRPGIVVTAKVTDAKAIESVLDGRLLTVSIGATSNAAVCSICGTDIIEEGFCGHMRGESYGGEIAEWVTGDLWFDELSWVNVPADQDAMIVGTSLYQESAGQSQEGLEATRLTVSLQPPSFLEGVETVEHTEETVVEETTIVELSVEEQLAQVNAEKILLEQEKNALTLENQQLKKEKEGLEEGVEETETPEADPETPAETVLTEEVVVEEATTVLEEVEETTVAEEAPVELSALEVEIESLKEQLNDAKDEIKQLEAANVSLVDELKTTVVEHLAYVSLNHDADTASMEEARAKYVGRTMESLKDTYADLAASDRLVKKNVVEQASDSAAHLRESVANPTVAVTEPTVVTESSKQIDGHDYLVNLLTGKR